MKLMRRGLAVLMAILLMVPTVVVTAEESPEPKAEAEILEENSNSDETGETAEETEEETKEETEEEIEEEELLEEAVEDGMISGAVIYNTGDYPCVVVDKEADEEAGNDYFEDDGSYTINIPERNPFFPYEVQFIYDGVTTEEWFMTPDDTVTIGDHQFSVQAVFDDDTVITQMKLNVAGKTVTVYPERKEFGSGIATYSLMPLTEKSLTADLSGFTPLELTMVSIEEIFTKGSESLGDAGKVAWTKNSYSDDYTVSNVGDKIDISLNTYYTNSKSLEMIVGDANQLSLDNIRYRVSLAITLSKNWLTAQTYTQAPDGTRKNVTGGYVAEYHDYNEIDGRALSINLPYEEIEENEDIYISIKANKDIYTNFDDNAIKIYREIYRSVDEINPAREITSEIWNNQSMESKDSGYKMGERYQYPWITMVSYDNDGNVTGLLPFYVYCDKYAYDNQIGLTSLYLNSEEVSYTRSFNYAASNDAKVTCKLYKGYAADAEYNLGMGYYKYTGAANGGTNADDEVTAAFAGGKYNTIAEAKAAGKKDIRGELFGNKGYNANYSGVGVTFSVFVGEDGTTEQEKYYYTVVAEEGEREKFPLNGNTNTVFSGLYDGNGSSIANCYRVQPDEDSYAEFNYLTFLVDKDTDLTKIAPVFSEASYRVYVGGSVIESEEVKSGKNPQDFSNGPVQYTVASENGREQKNYWIQVVKQTDSTNNQEKLYINSLKDPEAATTQDVEGVYQSKREMMIDGYHKNVHDILLINTSTNAIPALKAELISATVEIDDYWMLDGTKSLSGLTTFERDSNASHGELANLAKLRLKKKDGVEDGADISGTLTIKSADKVLVVLNLTGTLGDPSIITETIPEAVKYVPYGSMIHNNNKYSSNYVSYRLAGGTLPSGMELKENGELYGVPKQAGSFTFIVEMSNSFIDFNDSWKQFTLKVLENTDANVENATDENYTLRERVANIDTNATGTQIITSEGELAEFVDIYLDGIKLTENTDYTKESGSTKITIQAQTLKSVGVGTHTLGMEFRKADKSSEYKELKRAAQNYTVTNKNNISGTGNSNSGSNNSGNGNGNSSTTNIVAEVPADAFNNKVTTVYYTVVAGDTLSKIAQKYYGASKDWEKIFAANADIIRDPNLIYVGQVLTIYLSGDNSIITVPNENGSGDIIYYTVQPGDSLWKISKKYYGSGKQWRKIYQNNTNIISNPERLHIGQMIAILK